MEKCLYCYKPLSGKTDFHSSCSRKIFGSPVPPELPYAENELEELAKNIIKSQVTLTGVQAKLSLHISKGDSDTKRFTIVGLWGGYILKPASSNYPQLPEVEDLTMHLAEIAKIPTVPHSLIRMKSGNLAYITKRIDRIKKSKLHMEDMCQLTERLTEDKYRGSYEQVAKTILKYSKLPGLDLVNFYEQVVFSFLTGNADMHLKNFSLITRPGLGPVLSPAYDMLCTAIVNPADDEELALTLNGKKKKIRKGDFTQAFNVAGLDKRQQENIISKMMACKEDWLTTIQKSFLSDEFKEKYAELLVDRISVFEG